MGGAHAIQWFFAGVSIVGFFFALLFLPETHGKKLSDIENHFKSKSQRPKPNAKKATNRRPKQTLETVKEAEKMIKGPDSV